MEKGDQVRRAGGGGEGGDKHTVRDRRRLFSMPMQHTLSAGIRAARWMLTHNTHTHLHVAKKTR